MNVNRQSEIALRLMHSRPTAPSTLPPEFDWRDEALCAQTDAEVFYPERGGSPKRAKRICAACPVKAECLQMAMDTHEEFGIWGGTSERDRRKLRKTWTGAA